MTTNEVCIALAHPTPLENRHWGLCAYELIRPGTIIRQEGPLVTLELPVLYSDWTYDVEEQFYVSEYNKETDYIKQALSGASAQEHYAFRRIRTHRQSRHQSQLDINRFQLHARTVPYTDHNMQTMTRLVLFWNVSGINHSCRPNAVLNVRDNRAIVHAVTNIAVGEEIVIDRLPDSLTCETAQRRRIFLQERYAHDCRCCDCHSDTHREGDRIRRRLKWLNNKLAIKTQISCSNAQLVSALLLATEYLNLVTVLQWHDKRLAEAHTQFARIHEVLGERTHAVNHAVRIIAVATWAYGIHGDGLPHAALAVIQSCFPLD